MIRIQGITKRSPQRLILDSVDLHVETGEIFGLVGTNGAGRTSLLNIVATLSKPTSGQVEIADLDVLRRPLKARQCIGYVPESPGFYEDLQIGDYLDFVAALRHLSPSRKTEAIALALARCTLDPACPIRRLSKGHRQQLALATALLHNPPVLLLDEPTTYLDPLAHRRFHTLLQELHAQGATLLLACNTASDLQRLCHRIGFMHQGRLLEIRRPEGAALDAADVLQALLETHAEDRPAASPPSGRAG